MGRCPRNSVDYLGDFLPAPYFYKCFSQFFSVFLWVVSDGPNLGGRTHQKCSSDRLLIFSVVLADAAHGEAVNAVCQWSATSCVVLVPQRAVRPVGVARQ
jgi:hypothetical protein